MCGFAGIFAYSTNAQPVLDAELLRIRDQMLHRDPDGKGLWISSDKLIGIGIGLGHRRLSIIDLSENGAQPMSSIDGGYQNIFIGEILTQTRLLSAYGNHFSTASNWQVL